MSRSLRRRVALRTLQQTVQTRMRPVLHLDAYEVRLRTGHPRTGLRRRVDHLALTQCWGDAGFLHYFLRDTA